MGGSGVLHLVGLGLGPAGMSVGALRALRGCATIFVERYTAPASDGALARWEQGLGRPLLVLSRRQVEQGTSILAAAAAGPTALCVVGDPLAATTHQELRLTALEAGLAVHYWPGTSILTVAPSLAGLHHSKFGRLVTLPFPQPGFVPTSPVEHLLDNLRRGLHTLVLLDLPEDGSRTMTVSEAAAILWATAQRLTQERGDGVAPGLDDGTAIVAIASAGWPDASVVAAPLGRWRGPDPPTVGPTPHCLVVVGALHFQEERALARWSGPAPLRLRAGDGR